MSTHTAGVESRFSNPESPRVVAEEPKTPSQEHHEPSLSPDRPPAASGGVEKTRRPRGFAAMDRKLVSEIARKGGKAAHSAGTAHEFTSDEAREAGRKGGRATHAKRRQTSDAPPPETSATNEAASSEAGSEVDTE